MDVTTSFLEIQQPPDFDTNADRGPYLIRICSAMITLSGVAAILRLICRRQYKYELRWDDWLIFVALPFSWAPGILTISCVKFFQFGKHLQKSTLSDIKNVWILLYASQIVYPVSVVLTKASILLLLYRTFNTLQVKLYTSMMTITVVAWGISALLVAIFTCSPIHAYWDLDFTPRRCLNMLQYFLGTQIPNIFLGLAILIPPLPYLWMLQTKWMTKLALLPTYILSAFIIVLAGLRLNTVYVNQSSLDFTYDYVDLTIWTALETNLGILCACLPTLYPLVQVFARATWEEDYRKLSACGNQRSSARSPQQAKPVHFSRPRRAPLTATSSFGFNQPVPVYEKSIIYIAHEDSFEQTESPSGSEDRTWRRVSEPRVVLPHVATMAFHRAEPLFDEANRLRYGRVARMEVGTLERCNEYIRQGWI